MHERAMRRALDLAASVRASASPNPWVGSVIEPGGFEGATQPPGGSHAEIVALDRAGEAPRPTAPASGSPAPRPGPTPTACGPRATPSSSVLGPCGPTILR